MNTITGTVVAGVESTEWTIVHANTPADEYDHGRYVFATRQDMERYAATSRVGKEIESLSYFPNQYVIIIDEAWSLKFTSPAPTISSTEEGQQALNALIGDRMTEAQRVLSREFNYITFKRDPIEVIAQIENTKHFAETHIALDPANWTPNGEVDADGILHTSARRVGKKFMVTGPGGEFVGVNLPQGFERAPNYTGPVMATPYSPYTDPREVMFRRGERREPTPERPPVPLYLRLAVAA